MDGSRLGPKRSCCFDDISPFIQLHFVLGELANVHLCTFSVQQRQGHTVYLFCQAATESRETGRAGPARPGPAKLNRDAARDSNGSGARTLQAPPPPPPCSPATRMRARARAHTNTPSPFPRHGRLAAAEGQGADKRGQASSGAATALTVTAVAAVTAATGGGQPEGCVFPISDELRL
jgi:hypothetical protein